MNAFRTAFASLCLILLLPNITFAQVFNDSVKSLTGIIDSYKLPGLTLKNLSQKILYKKTPQQDLCLYLLQPEKKQKRLPAIIYFYGGGWEGGDVQYILPTAAWFRDNGLIAIAVDYRVKSRNGTSPLECIEDAKSAVRYVREHAKELGVNPTKIIVAGGSAGGHLALCTLLNGGDAPGENLKVSAKPNALVLHNPVVGVGFREDFFAAHPEYSPILQIKNNWPPTIVSNGTEDKTTPYSGALSFTKKMNEMGNVCELISVKNADHSCDWPITNPNFLPTITKMTQFLIEQKFIKKSKSKNK